MMADSISSGEKKLFAEKIRILQSSADTYYSLSGSEFFLSCVGIFDEWLYIKDQKNDFIEGNTSFEMLKEVFVKMLVTLNEENTPTLINSRLFFIERGTVVYYNLIVNNNKVVQTEKVVVNENYFTDSCIQDSPEHFEWNFGEIEEKCRAYLARLGKGLDTKERIGFIQLNNDGTKKYQRPFKYMSDIIAYYYGLSFDRIDNDDFKWDFGE